MVSGMFVLGSDFFSPLNFSVCPIPRLADDHFRYSPKTVVGRTVFRTPRGVDLFVTEMPPFTKRANSSRR